MFERRLYAGEIVPLEDLGLTAGDPWSLLCDIISLRGRNSGIGEGPIFCLSDTPAVDVRRLEVVVLDPVGADSALWLLSVAFEARRRR